MNKKVFYSLALFGFVMLLNNCGKTCVESSYSFDMTEQFYPESDSIKIGDTLWVTSSHATTFTDRLSSSDINYSGSTLGLNIRLLKFDGGNVENTGTSGAFPVFTTIIINGSSVGGDNLPEENKSVNFEESNNMFLLKVAFIPKDTGTYGISLGDAGAVRHNHGCELATANISNANASNHLYLYQNSRPGYEISTYESTHLYCFKVY